MISELNSNGYFHFEEEKMRKLEEEIFGSSGEDVFKNLNFIPLQA
jgi:hypothetical protein